MAQWFSPGDSFTLVGAKMGLLSPNSVLCLNVNCGGFKVEMAENVTFNKQ